uniref:Sarcolemmal membrane-associated protein n=1 Tax=Ciona savignyi TaxID=51511 RepID=H2YEG9_CIOSA
MTAAIHFCCCPNSHPFKDRHILLKEPTKIGRSVARSRPATNNAVFDCKVLSRNHALLWYENGKFYIQDTRSSNGTFVNNQRLSKATEESAAVEVNSCDIVQFGVDVVDNTRKLTHGCIVSRIRLFLPNGEESKQSTTRNTSILEKVPFNNNPLPSVQSQDLYQLHQYLQEALHREQMLEQKLALLQRLVVNSHDASEKGWQALINEDRLLSRLEFLENQLQTLNKNQNEDELNMKLQQLQEDKYNYENTSKETLRKALQEKLEAVRKLSNLERSLSNTEDECTHLRLMHEQTQNELAELAATHQSKIKELHELTEKLQEMERKHEESKATIEIQQNELQRELTDLQQEESALRVKFNSLQEEADLRNTEKEVPNNVCHEDRGIQVEQMDKIDKLFNGADELENIVNSGKLKHSLKDQMDDLTKLQEELSSKNEVIEANEQEILSLKNDLDSARMAAVENVSEVTLLRHKLSEREDEMKTLLESATSDLQHQLSDAKLEIDARTNTADQLQDQLAEMESCLSEL